MKLSDIIRLMFIAVMLLGFESWLPAGNSTVWAQSAIEANAQYNIDKTINFPAELVATLPDGFEFIKDKDAHAFGAGLQSSVSFSVTGTRFQNYAGRKNEIILLYEYRWFNCSDAIGNYSWEMCKNVDYSTELEIETGGDEKGKESLGSGILSWCKVVCKAYMGEPERIYYTCKWIGKVGDGWLFITIKEIPQSKDQAYKWISKIRENILKIDMHQYLMPVTEFEEE
jgi:hypothetical protein